MKRVKMIALAASVAALSSMSSSPVMAQTFSPSNGLYNVSGALNLYQTVPGVWCYVNADLRIVAGAAQLENITFSPGHLLCGGPVAPLSDPWPLTPISAAYDSFSAYVYVNTYLGYCLGELAKIKLVGPDQIVFAPDIPIGPKVDGGLYDTPGNYECFVDGSLTITPAPNSGSTLPVEII